MRPWLYPLVVYLLAPALVLALGLCAFQMGLGR